MTSDAAPAVPAGRTDSRPRAARARGIVAVVLILSGIILTPLGIVGFWSHRTLTDTQQYLDTVGPIGDDAATKAALSQFITDKIEARVDPEQLVEQIFGDLIERYPRLELMVPIVAGAVDAVITDTVDKLVYSEQFDEVWRGLNLAAQKSFLAILEGREEGPVRLQGEQIVLDVGELLAIIKQRLIERGLTFLENVDFPEVDRTIVLLNAPQLAQVRTIYSITSPIMRWLIVFVVALFVFGAFVAVRRPRAVTWIGAGLVVWSVVLAAALRIGQSAFTNQLEGTPFGPASDVFYTTLLRYLDSSVWGLLLVGLGLWFVGFFLSRARGGHAMRSGAAALTERAAEPLRGGPLESAGTWVQRNARWLRVLLAAGVLIAVLVGGEPTVLRTLVFGLVALVLITVISVLAAIPGRPDAAEGADHPQPVNA